MHDGDLYSLIYTHENSKFQNLLKYSESSKNGLNLSKLNKLEYIENIVKFAEISKFTEDSHACMHIFYVILIILNHLKYYNLFIAHKTVCAICVFDSSSPSPIYILTSRYQLYDRVPVANGSAVQLTG